MKKNLLRIVGMASFYFVTVLMLQSVSSDSLIASEVKGDDFITKTMISLQLQEVTLEKAFQKIEDLTDLKFFYIKEEIPVKEKVSVYLINQPLSNVLEQFASRFNISFKRINSQIVVKKKRALDDESILPPAPVGKLKGKVLGRDINSGLIGANILLLDTEFGTTTNEAGDYELENIPEGNYTVLVRFVGYRNYETEITIEENKTLLLDVELLPAAVQINEVVVTGSLVETERRKLEIPVAVIRETDLENSPLRRVDEIFRGTVPGAASFELGPTDYFTVLSLRGGNSFFFNSVKTYIDGIEVSDPLIISTIDKNNIERIEVTRGPGASTMYGSDAGGGIIQIFTKKGTGKSRFSLSVAGGPIESKWVDKTAMQQEYNAEYSAGITEFSYNIGGSYRKVGEYVPDYENQNYSFYGGVRTVSGPVTVDFTLRYAQKSFDWFTNPILRDLGYAPYLAPRNEEWRLSQNTIGFNVSYVPTNWFSHNLVVGYDRNETNYYNTEPRFLNPVDTLIQNNSANVEGFTIKYYSSIFYPQKGDFKSVFTFGGEYGKERESGYFGRTNILFGFNVSPGPINVLRDEYENYGYFAQWKPEMWDKVFLTLGFRVEDHDFFGDDFGTAFLPKLGLAANFDIADIIIKPRISYGKGINPATRDMKFGVDLGGFSVAPNPDIGPEAQEGIDFGADLYLLGGNLSFELTYYDQTAKDLINRIFLVQPGPGIAPVLKHVNVGEIKNKGIEFAAGFTFNRFELKTTFSSLSSKIEKLHEGYLGREEEGDDLLEVPNTVAGLNAGYRFDPLFNFGLGGSVSVEFTYFGNWKARDVQYELGIRYGGLPPLPPGDLIIEMDPVFKANLAFEYKINEYVDFFIQIKNISDSYDFERNNTSVSYGRSWLVGTRFSLE